VLVLKEFVMATQQDANANEGQNPIGEEIIKPDSEVMTMEVPTGALDDKTPTSDEEEIKSTSKEEVKSEESSSEDVKDTPDDNLSEDDQRHLSERTQKRIRELNEKAKKAEELEVELEELKSRQEDRFVKPYENAINKGLFTDDNSFQNTPFETSSNKSLPWDMEQPQSEEKVITMEEYQKNVLNTADIIVQARMAQFNKANEIRSDLEKVESKYEELNPESDEYNEDVSNKISSLFETQLKADQNARLSKFVDSIMSLRKKSEQKGKDSVTTKMVEQKAEEAISPHEIEPAPDKPFEKLSLDEKEKYLKEKGLW